jgi:hypothetical protein
MAQVVEGRATVALHAPATGDDEPTSGFKRFPKGADDENEARKK